MPRIRTVKPEFWDDQKLSLIKRDARLTFIGLWTYADDNGVVKAHPLWLKNKIYPYDDISISEFESWLSDLESISAIIKYTHESENFYYIKNFSKHQVINKPNTKNCNPLPPENIMNCTLLIPDNSGIDTGKIPVGKERKGKEQGRERNRKGKDIDRNGFDIFWSGYPIKIAKQQALKTWDKLIQNGDLPDVDFICSAISKQKAHKEKLKEMGEFCPEWKHPATWLNAGCWDDECIIDNPNADTHGPRGKILKASDEYDS